MRFANAQEWRGRLWGLGLLLGLVLGTAATPAIAQGSNNPPPNTRPGEAPDDETIGTLPSVQGTTAITIQRVVHDARPSMYVAGPAEVLFNALLAADALGGPAAATVTDLGAGRIRITFYGAVRVLLDRETIELANSVTTGLSAQQSQISATQLFLGSRKASLGTLTAGETELPVLALSQSGVLDAGALRATTRLANGRRIGQSFEATGNLLVLTQAR
jgi:hypothetical protein